MIRDLIREKADDLNDKILNAQTTSKNKSFGRMGGESCGSLNLCGTCNTCGGICCQSDKE